MRSTRLAAIADAAAIVLFVAVGRDSHDEGGALVETFLTATPFFVAATGGWAVALLRLGADSATRVWPFGVIVWLTTAVAGLVLRGLTGGGLSGGFPLVTLLVLGILVLGWRFAVGRWQRHRPTAAPSR